MGKAADVFNHYSNQEAVPAFLCVDEVKIYGKI